MSHRFYKVREVEYFTDFDLFYRQQMMVIRSLKNELRFCSRLEFYIFKTQSAVHKIPDEEELQATARQLHADLLAGKHGVGELVN